MDPLFVSVAEFGRLFSISRSKAHELVMAGRIQTTWLDGRRLIPREEIDRLAEELRTKLAGAQP